MANGFQYFHPAKVGFWKHYPNFSSDTSVGFAQLASHSQPLSPSPMRNTGKQLKSSTSPSLLISKA